MQAIKKAPQQKPEAGLTSSTTASKETPFYEAQLLADAAAIDHAAATQESKNPVDQVLAGELAPGATVETKPPEADPAVQQSLALLVGLGTAYMSTSKGWGDPGDEWRAEVARLGAVLIDRYLPNFLSEQGEIIALAVMVGSYAATNLIGKTATPAIGSNGNSRNAGERKDHFVVADPPGRVTSHGGYPAT